MRHMFEPFANFRKKMKKTVYYKYRSLENFDRVLDILVNNTIYASRFDNLKIYT